MQQNHIHTINHFNCSGECVGIRSYCFSLPTEFEFLDERRTQDMIKEIQYFYHTDHLGSSSWITDATGSAYQHMQSLPFGEDFIDQRTSSWTAPYRFTGKERDTETGWDYFGARYYDSDLSVWLSVVPIAIGTMASKYPSMSAYMYCAGNPVMMVDPDGREFDDPDDVKRAQKSQETARTRITDLNKTITGLESRTDLNDAEKQTLVDSKDQKKVLEDHISHIEDMITNTDWKFAYKKVGEKSKTDTYYKKGVVTMEYREDSPNAQAHEETHGYQYISGDLKVVNGRDDNSSYDIGDEAQAYKVQVSYVNSERQKAFYNAVNVPEVKGVKDITGDNLSKSKFMRDNYPAFIFENYKK